jgi:hypothetical protein
VFLTQANSVGKSIYCIKDMFNFGYLLWDLVSHPFCTATILLFNWIYIKIVFEDWNKRFYTYSYADGFQHFRFWKAIPASVGNSSIFLVLFHISCFWNLRVIESYYGTIYMIKITFLMILVEQLLTYFIINMIVARLTPSAAHSAALASINIHSSSSLVLGWITFQAIKYLVYPTHFPLFSDFLLGGFLSIPISMVPILLLMMYYLFQSKDFYYANLMGLLSGYVLGFGVDSLLASNYWTFCFLLDVILLMCLSWKFLPVSESSPTSASSGEVASQILFRTYYGTAELSRNILYLECYDISTISGAQEMNPLFSREVEMTSINPPSASTSLSPRRSSSLMNNLRVPGLSSSSSSANALSNTLEPASAHGEEYDEEALQPLLRESKHISGHAGSSSLSSTPSFSGSQPVKRNSPSFTSSPRNSSSAAAAAAAAARSSSSNIHSSGKKDDPHFYDENDEEAGETTRLAPQRRNVISDR